MTTQKKYKQLKAIFKTQAIANYLNKNGFVPASARGYTKQNVANSIFHNSDHPDFIEGISKMHSEFCKWRSMTLYDVLKKERHALKYLTIN